MALESGKNKLKYFDVEWQPRQTSFAYVIRLHAQELLGEWKKNFHTFFFSLVLLNRQRFSFLSAAAADAVGDDKKLLELMLNKLFHTMSYRCMESTKWDSVTDAEVRYAMNSAQIFLNISTRKFHKNIIHSAKCMWLWNVKE